MSGILERRIGRRALLAAAGIVAGAVALAGGAADVFAQDKAKIKVAAIYTVPVEQQWVARIHKALNAAKARGEIEIRVLRERRQHRLRARHAPICRSRARDLIVGEVFGVERAARAVAGDYPEDRVPDGLVASGRRSRTSSVFDNFIQEPSYLTGMVAGRHDQVRT